jgi:hypothetical protein
MRVTLERCLASTGANTATNLPLKRNSIMDKRTRLTRQIQFHDNKVRELEQQLERLSNFPSEEQILGHGDVIEFEYSFRDNDRRYSYAAIHIAGRGWYTTGPEAPKAFSWDELVAWWDRGTLHSLSVMMPMTVLV